MSRGLLLTLTEPPPAMEEEFNAWYDHEHLAERLAIPGFRSAQRWVADVPPGAVKYLATYECSSVHDLAAPGYLKLLANQTPWTQAVMARFTRFNRLTLRVQIDLAHGVGGAVAAVRFVPDPRKRMALSAWLQKTVLPKVTLGDAVMIHCDGCKADVPARVTFISRTSEFTPPVIYSLDERSKLVFLVEARTEASGDLRVGQPVDVRFAEARK